MQKKRQSFGRRNSSTLFFVPKPREGANNPRPGSNREEGLKFWEKRSSSKQISQKRETLSLNELKKSRSKAA